MRRPGAWIVAALLASAGLLACGSSRPSNRPHSPNPALPAGLIARSRPIGRGAPFHPPARGPVIGPCRRQPGRRIGVHVELFAANRVVLVPAGIGTRPPRTFSAGRIATAACYGELMTLEPTGVVQVRPRARLRTSDLFRSWGQPLSRTRLGPFGAGDRRQVEAFVDGRRWTGAPEDVPLRAHSEIVLEVGPHVPPHRMYTFPPGT